MLDYGALLERMIAETRDDPARRRQIVYELARLTLRRQLQQTSPPLGLKATRDHLAGLEAAIVACEDAARRDRAPDCKTAPAEIPDSGEPDAPEQASRPSTAVTARTAEHPQPLYARPEVIPIGPFTVEPIRIADPVATAPHPSRSGQWPRRRWIELAIVAVVPVAAYAASDHGRSGPPAAVAPLAVQVASPGPPPGLPASQPPDPPPPTQAMAATHPLPTVYGVYALRDGQLVELEQVTTAPVDPRVKSIVQISTPSRTILSDRDLSFLVFRRDLITAAPERVPIRVAARLARTMTFDPAGKAVTAPPHENRWIIRDIGFDFRVRPVRDNQEMVWVQPDDRASSLPAGRYVLMMNGTPYDFSIEGPVTAPAQCLESVATARGPTLYECKPN